MNNGSVAIKFMIPKPLSDISEADLQHLKEAGVEEGKTIEYKRELPGTRDEDKREFLADVSSFANTDGGDILYGADEDRGVITSLMGVSSPDFDIEKSRLESLIRDGIAPRINATLQFVNGSFGRLLVVRVEKSWIGPHRVIFRGHDKFYARTSAGKFALDVGQLRSAFLQSGALSEWITGFRADRIIDISAGRTPVSVEDGAKAVLHIIPLGAFSGELEYDVRLIHKEPFPHSPWGSSTLNSQMTFDGVVVYTPTSDRQVSSFSHFFRNGILEAVTASALVTKHPSGKLVIPHVAFEGTLLNYLPRCFQSLHGLGVHPPVSVSLTLLGMRGLEMATNAFGFSPRANPIREETLVLPGRIVDTFSTPASLILKPMLDRIWNACGLLETPNIDESGAWKASTPLRNFGLR
jgi:hypothetical protein